MGSTGVISEKYLAWSPCIEGNQRRLGIPPVTSVKIPQLGRDATY